MKLIDYYGNEYKVTLEQSGVSLYFRGSKHATISLKAYRTLFQCGHLRWEREAQLESHHK